jgi:hypothetical protein
MDEQYLQLIKSIQKISYYSEIIPIINKFYLTIIQSDLISSRRKKEINVNKPFPILLFNITSEEIIKQIEIINKKYDFYWNFYNRLNLDDPKILESFNELQQLEQKIEITIEQSEHKLYIQTFAIENLENIKNRICLEFNNPLFIFFDSNFNKNKESNNILDLYYILYNQFYSDSPILTTKSKKKITDIDLTTLNLDIFQQNKTELCNLFTDSKIDDLLIQEEQDIVVSKPSVSKKKKLDISKWSEIIINIYNQFKDKYEIELRQYINLCFIFYIKEEFRELKNEDISSSLLLAIFTDVEKLMKSIEFENFNSDFYNPRGNIIDNKKEIIECFFYNIHDFGDWYKILFNLIKNNKSDLLKNVKKNMHNILEIYNLGTLEIINEKNVGCIKNLKLKTNSTTGKIFNDLLLNEKFVLAKYKVFYKILSNTFINDDDENLENLNDTNLRIFNKDNNIIIYCKNDNEYLYIQYIASLEINIEYLLQFLNIKEYDELIELQDVGIMEEFLIINNKNESIKSEIWNPMDSSILSNIIMNNDLFSKIFYINDTDKISRQNKSIFIYFKNLNSEIENINIFVGGWNRIHSRFGDLTAILTPIFDDISNSYFVHVKITRSKDLQTIYFFKIYLKKLLYFYNKEFDQQIELFKEYYKYFSISTKIEDNIFKTNSFNPNIFGFKTVIRGCQKPRKCNIISDSEANTKNKDKILLFPSLPYFEFDILPQYYICNDSKHQYPQLIQNYDKNHPLGYAPCCFIKKQSDHESFLENVNRRIQKLPYIDFEISFNFINESLKKLIPLSKSYLLRLRHIQQIAIIQPNLNNLLKFIFYSSGMTSKNIFYSFYRLGTSSWIYDSLLSCLEYFNQKLKIIPANIHTSLYKESNLHSVRNQSNPSSIISIQTLRKLLIDFISLNNLSLFQNHCDLDYFISILNDPYKTILAEDFLYILQEFYNVNIIILGYKKDDDDDDKIIDISLFKPKFNKKFVLNYQEIISERPFLFLLEHQSNQIIIHYELIIYSKIDDILNLDNDNIFYFSMFNHFFYDLFRKLYSSFYLCYSLDNSRYLLQPSFDLTIFKLNNELPHYQYIDLYGKIQMIFFKLKKDDKNLFYLAILFNSSIPIPNYLNRFNHIKNIYDLNKKILNKCSQDSQFILNYLQSNNISYQQYRYNNYLLIHPENAHYFLCIQSSIIDESLPINDQFKITFNILNYLIDDKDISEIDLDLYSNKLANILQDYCLHLFVHYCHEKDLFAIISSSSIQDIKKIIKEFILLKIIFEHEYDYPSYDELNCKFNNNPRLFKDDKLILIHSMKKKIVYFLLWFIKTKFKVFMEYLHLIEIPSFYQYSTDFKLMNNQNIQTSIRNFNIISLNDYISIKLSEINPQVFKLGIFYYYLCLEEIKKFFINAIFEPYLFIFYNDLDEAIERSSKLLKIDTDDLSFLSFSDKKNQFIDTKLKSKTEFLYSDYHLLIKRFTIQDSHLFLILIPFSKII